MSQGVCDNLVRDNFSTRTTLAIITLDGISSSFVLKANHIPSFLVIHVRGINLISWLWFNLLLVHASQRSSPCVAQGGESIDMFDARAALYGFPANQVNASQSLNTDADVMGASQTGLSSIMGGGMQLSEGGTASMQERGGTSMVSGHLNLLVYLN